MMRLNTEQGGIFARVGAMAAPIGRHQLIIMATAFVAGKSGA